MKSEKNKNLKSITLYLIISVLGGMVGTFIIILYVISWINIDLAFLPMQGNIRDIVTRPPQKFIVEQDIAYDKIFSNMKYSIVEVYDTSTISQTTIFGLNSLIYPKQFLGKGIILTTDGWLASYIKNDVNKDNIGIEKELSEIMIVLDTDKSKIYHPVIMKKDEFSEIIFMKIDASGLSVMPLVEPNGINDAQAVILAGQDCVGIENIDNISYNAIIDEKDYIKSSDLLNRTLLVNNDLNNASLVIDLKGALAGFMNSKNTAIPASVIDKAFKSILKHQEVLRPSLGIEYIDLTTVLSADDNFNNRKGSLVYKTMADSAAFSSGIKIGDLILKVENEEVKDNNLSELIQEYDKGTLVNFTILRGEEEIVLSVALK